MCSCSGMAVSKCRSFFPGALLPLLSASCLMLSAAQSNRSQGAITEELQQRFDRIKELMEQSDDDDAELRSNFSEIEKQLEELKRGKVSLEEAKEQLDRSREHLDHADAAWTATCFALATETLGGRLTKEIMTSLERLAADDLPAEEAAEMPLFRMANVCMQKRAEGGETSTLALELLQQVKAAMKRGKRPPKMPQAWVNFAESEDAAVQVREQSKRQWDLMKIQADVAVKNNHWTKRGPPLFFLVFALPLPLYYLVDWLLRKWRTRKAEVEADAKKDEKEKPSPKKESKKQK